MIYTQDINWMDDFCVDIVIRNGELLVSKSMNSGISAGSSSIDRQRYIL